MSVRGEKVTDKFGFTRDKMYIDNIKTEDIFDFFRQNAPFGGHFGTTEEVARNYEFKEGYLSYKKEQQKMHCLYLPKHKVAFGNVVAGFTFDDFSCVYEDYTKNEVDLSDEWCKFVCEKVKDIDYLTEYQDLMHEKMEALRIEYESKVGKMRDQLIKVTDIAIESNKDDFEDEIENYEDEIDYIGEDGYDDEVIEQEVPEIDDAVKRFLDSRMEGNNAFYEDDYADEMGDE